MEVTESDKRPSLPRDGISYSCKGYAEQPPCLESPSWSCVQGLNQVLSFQKESVFSILSGAMTFSITTLRITTISIAA
jgi:hypothetical protein